MYLQDTVELKTNGQKTSDGSLKALVRAGRTGIQVYRGSEVGRPDLDKVRIYRPPEQVFNKDTLESFTNLTLTLDHPNDLVDAKSWKKVAVGYSGEEAIRDGGFVKVPILLKDADAIQQVENGQRRELSFGYTCDVELQPGTTPSGEAYDGIQKNIRGNHLAIVPAGRAGKDCRIGDEGKKPMATKMMTVDGFQVEVTDAAESAIKKLQGDKAQLTTDNVKLIADHTAALQAKDAEIAKITAERDEAKKQIKTDADLDKLVEERADTVSKAKALGLGDGDIKSKSSADVRRLAVAKKFGDSVVAGRNDDYVQAMFDAAAATAGSNQQQNGGGFVQRPGSYVPDQDPINRGMRTAVNDGTPEQAHKAMIDHLTNAYKGPQQGQTNGATHWSR